MTLSENIQNLRRVKIYFDNEKDEENGTSQDIHTFFNVAASIAKIQQQISGIHTIAGITGLAAAIYQFNEHIKMHSG
jgi:hypothetical protein